MRVSSHTFPFTSPPRILSTLSSSSLESHKPPFSSSSPTPPAPSLNSTMANGGEHRNEIAFFDVETTFPTRTGQGHAILEFGSILVCPKKLVELESYSTLVRPHDLSLINTLSVRCNGITKDAVLSASTFSDIADRVYDILHGRIWAGHNILRFDCYRIREAFAQINRSAPEPKGTIDSLALLTQKFGRRAGDMKMASLATYFGLGQQTHRSLGDVRMNLEVLKYCATVLFLESSLPDIFTEKSWVSPNAITRSRSGKAFPDAGSGTSSASSSRKIKNCIIPSSVNQRIEENHPILSFVTHNSTEEQIPDLVEINTTEPDPFDLALLGDKNVIIDVPSHEQMDEQSSRTTAYVTSSGCTDFLLPHEISIPSISVAFVPFYRGSQKLQILHSNLALQIRCSNLKVRFGLSTKFLDHAGRPRLSFVVDLTPNLSAVLDACDDLAKCLFNDSGSDSEWRPVVARKPGFFNTPTIRLHVPMISENNNARWTTEIYQKDMNSMQQFVFSGYDVAELEALVRPGSTVDVYFSMDPYDYQQNAGIKLLLKKLIVHSN